MVWKGRYLSITYREDRLLFPDDAISHCLGDSSQSREHGLITYCDQARSASGAGVSDSSACGCQRREDVGRKFEALGQY